MDTKFVLIGLVAIIVVAVLAVTVSSNHQSGADDDGATTYDIEGYWYMVDGMALIEGTGVQNMISDSCEIPVNFTNLRVDEAGENVFYGTMYNDRIVGMYFDDGRITYKYPVTDSNGKSSDKLFKGYYKDGLIYGITSFVYPFASGEKQCIATYVLSKNPADTARLVDTPSFAGEWNLFESHALTGDSYVALSGGTMSMGTHSDEGLFSCTMSITTEGSPLEADCNGLFMNIPIHGKYYGFMVNPVNNQTWELVFDGNSITALAILRTSDSSNILTSLSLSFTQGDKKADYNYPVIPKGVYYSHESRFSCVPGGVGTIIKSNTPFMMNITEQCGPCFSGTVIIDGTSFPSTGVIDSEGHITICYLAGTWIDYAYGDYHNDEIEICASIFTETLGRCARYVEMDRLPDNHFIEDTDGLLGTWFVSSYAAPDGDIDTIFHSNIHQIPLYISSIEGGVVKGYLFNTEFMGTYGPTTTGQGSFWIHLPYKGGVFSGEFVATHNDLLFATISYKHHNSEDVPEVCQVVYTKDNQYSPVPNHGVDVFDKTWETYSVMIWDGNQVVKQTPDFVSMELNRTPKVEDKWGLNSFFDVKFTGQVSMALRGAFYSVDVNGNGIANLHGANNDCISLYYYEGKVYVQGSMKYYDRLVSFSVIFREKGSTDDSLYQYRFCDIAGKTFKNGNFSLSVTKQEGPFVYGTISSVYDGRDIQGTFIGLQLSISGPVYIETILMFDDGKTWDSHIVLNEDGSGNVTSISFEAVWYDADGESYSSSLVAYV